MRRPGLGTRPVREESRLPVAVVCNNTHARFNVIRLSSFPAEFGSGIRKAEYFSSIG